MPVARAHQNCLPDSSQSLHAATPSVAPDQFIIRDHRAKARFWAQLDTPRCGQLSNWAQLPPSRSEARGGAIALAPSSEFRLAHPVVLPRRLKLLQSGTKTLSWSPREAIESSTRIPDGGGCALWLVALGLSHSE
eukprot:CAMPEP_0181191742 /NCGR_PEP_ID=MMETSP1096-20121128/12896_1 /TAXON_ID=156174 ORGANISM="Chrysochromulina ericina, Strain CCMP281" /NCGR_SAMPLE_ID=MMETSP1096 /ASSEMBLY_ACC=CAM_ASM_000453 /LENGTH=134 /DNA_ID=CAMNT_0023281059 /DNA_START=107 /DNA_END=512 /DNA_ORIENTATION=+